MTPYEIKVLLHYHASVTQKIDLNTVDRSYAVCDDCRPYVYDAGTLIVDVVDAGYLVLSEVWYPGWRAWVDEFQAVDSVSEGYPEAGVRLVWRSGEAGRGQVTETVLGHEPRRLHRIRYAGPHAEGGPDRQDGLGLHVDPVDVEGGGAASDGSTGPAGSATLGVVSAEWTAAPGAEPRASGSGNSMAASLPASSSAAALTAKRPSALRA